MQLFLAEFRTIINKWKLGNVFGICSLKEEPIGGPVTMEFTSGYTNMTLPFNIAPNDSNIVDAMWQFSSTLPGSSMQVASMAQCMSR